MTLDTTNNQTPADQIAQLQNQLAWYQQSWAWSDASWDYGYYSTASTARPDAGFTVNDLESWMQPCCFSKVYDVDWQSSSQDQTFWSDSSSRVIIDLKLFFFILFINVYENYLLIL